MAIREHGQVCADWEEIKLSWEKAGGNTAFSFGPKVLLTHSNNALGSPDCRIIDINGVLPRAVGSKSATPDPGCLVRQCRSPLSLVATFGVTRTSRTGVVL